MVKTKPLIAFLLVLALASLACGVNVNMPGSEIKTGETKTEEINVPTPSTSEPVDLTLAFGAGTLKLSAGASALVSGIATYNVDDFKPQVKEQGEKVRIEQGSLNLRGIPQFKEDVENEWDFKLGSQPMLLHISAGAYAGKYELGGLSIQELEVSDGAADVDLSFATPNLIEMNSLRYNTGASNVTLSGLGNANAATLIFRSGAGSYKLSFDGTLQRDMVVNIESGISSLVISIPKGVPAQVTFDGGMANVDIYGDWKKSGSTYTQTGSGPRITLIVKMGAGSMELNNK